MSEGLGSFCLVLHAHLPYVLRHGEKPHGAVWLYEAIAETYLPLLDLVGEIALNGVHAGLTIGITPILLSQLADDELKSGFVAYAAARAGRAREDRAEFLRQGDGQLAGLAVEWERWYLGKLEHFERIGRDLVGEFARLRREGHVQLLSGTATHAYLPLLLTDQSIRAQLAAGNSISRKHFGANLGGIWLPECAYRPAIDCWRPRILEQEGHYRAGLETFLPAVGANHTFIDSHLIAGGLPLGVIADGRFFLTGAAQAHRDRKAGWRETLSPVGIASEAGRAEVFAFARHPRLAEQVWSSKVGYPGDGAYLEFHKKHGAGGLRYWRVTDVCSDLIGKQAYEAPAVAGRIYANAQHFCQMVKETLTEYANRTGRRGICVAAFDAELFGHWWFEGPRFLRDVILTLAAEGLVKSVTAEAALAEGAPDKVMRPLEGSWGRNGDHSVWLNDKTQWMWQVIHRAEREMVLHTRNLPWQSNRAVADALAWAGRELLLMQASDWLFVVENGSALDYGIKRFSGHVTRFERGVEMAVHLAGGGELNPVQAAQIVEMKAHDCVLEEIDLRWWQ